MAVAKRAFHIAPAAVHLCDLHDRELRWFSVPLETARVTLPDWFQAHAAPWLDVLCAVPYALFIYAVLGFGAHLYFRSYGALRRLGWAFLLTNVAGFITYQLYPAAPPWYFHAHGCTVDLSVSPSEGPALGRVDVMLGVRYFGSMYGRAATVFGAVPSLHVAYPLLMVASGWRAHGALGRGLLVGWYAWMCLAAAYLDHHWVFDMVVGSAYALTASLVVFAVSAHLRDRAEAGERALGVGP
jgi:inositol phosphorylceramide synthase catalytic subunit